MVGMERKVWDRVGEATRIRLRGNTKKRASKKASKDTCHKAWRSDFNLWVLQIVFWSPDMHMAHARSLTHNEYVSKQT